jgi:LmbE family N-acetylglucosaminyl deacetylase
MTASKLDRLRSVPLAGVVAGIVLFLVMARPAAQEARRLVWVGAHADDEVAAAPLLARYAREGVQVFMLIVSDGSQGGTYTSIPVGPELARARGEEARCSAQALGAQPPIVLGFPDGHLGDYIGDRTRIYQITERVHAELQRLRPDVVITWGPDGGTGHPDHRIVSAVVTQLVRAAAPGVPERLFHASLPAAAMSAMNPARGAPPLMIPAPKYFSTHVAFTAADLDASRRAMACHKTQYNDDMLRRVSGVDPWNGRLSLVPAFSGAGADGVFGTR